jgi:hypothetical protein
VYATGRWLRWRPPDGIAPPVGFRPGSCTPNPAPPPPPAPRTRVGGAPRASREGGCQPMRAAAHRAKALGAVVRATRQKWRLFITPTNRACWVGTRLRGTTPCRIPCSGRVARGGGREGEAKRPRGRSSKIEEGVLFGGARCAAWPVVKAPPTKKNRRRSSFLKCPVLNGRRWD